METKTCFYRNVRRVWPWTISFTGPFVLCNGEIIREMSEIDIVGMDSLKRNPVS